MFTGYFYFENAYKMASSLPFTTKNCGIVNINDLGVIYKKKYISLILPFPHARFPCTMLQTLSYSYPNTFVENDILMY